MVGFGLPGEGHPIWMIEFGSLRRQR